MVPINFSVNSTIQHFNQIHIKVLNGINSTVNTYSVYFNRLFVLEISISCCFIEEIKKISANVFSHSEFSRFHTVERRRIIRDAKQKCQ